MSLPILTLVRSTDDVTLEVLKSYNVTNPHIHFHVVHDQPQLTQFTNTHKYEVIFYCSGDTSFFTLAVQSCVTSLRWIHVRAAGVTRFLIPEVRDSNITLTNSKGVFSESLAEYTLAGMLYFAKRIPDIVNAQQHANWSRFQLSDLRGKLVVVVGYGSIGQAVGRCAKFGFGMRVIGVRRAAVAGDECAERIVACDDLLSVLRDADYVVLSAALTNETHHMIGERELNQMKSSAVLVNVGRGALIDEPALVRLLKDGKIRGAVLDVFEQEPVPQEHPLFKLDNVLMSSHTADNTPGFERRAMDVFQMQLNRFTSDAENFASYGVDKDLGY